MRVSAHGRQLHAEEAVPANETGPRYPFALSSISLGTEPVIAADGSLWSHAATLGTRYKGEEFCIDRGCVENFVKVFTSGYPQKIPVDYEHGSTSADPEVRKLRVQGQVPKAGDVLELKGVFTPGDFTGDLKAAAEKLSAQAGRPLDDPRNFGLWMRWKPTARALAAIKAGEYTELSIAFDDDIPHNTNGEGQGPGLWAVALLNSPFLDDMLPVAASRDTGRSPAAPGSHEGVMTKLTVLSVAAALLGKAIPSEDEALNELNGLGVQLTELKTLREHRDVIAGEFGGEKDPAKQVVKIRELRTQVQTAQEAEKQAKAAKVKTTVETTITAYEKAIGNAALRKIMTDRLTAELEAGSELEKTETFQALKSMSPATNLTRHAGPDVGGAGKGDDEKIDAKARELMGSNPRLKRMVDTGNEYEAYKEAIVLAGRELSLVTA